MACNHIHLIALQKDLTVHMLRQEPRNPDYFAQQREVWAETHKKIQTHIPLPFSKCLPEHFMAWAPHVYLSVFVYAGKNKKVIWSLEIVSRIQAFDYQHRVWSTLEVILAKKHPFRQEENAWLMCKAISHSFLFCFYVPLKNRFLY